MTAPTRVKTVADARLCVAESEALEAPQIEIGLEYRGDVAVRLLRVIRLNDGRTWYAYATGEGYGYAHQKNLRFIERDEAVTLISEAQ